MLKEIRIGPWRKTAVLAVIFILCLFFYATRPLPEHAMDPRFASALERSAPQVSSELIPVGKDRFIRSVQGGVHSAFEFMLVHGADRRHQSAEHWRPHYRFFTEHGWMQALDLLGFGEAKPGAGDDVDITIEDQESALTTLLKEPPAGHAVKRIVVARSWGAAVLYGALGRLNDDARVHALVLIAPAVNTRTWTPPAWAAALPTLIIWAHEDSTVPYVRAKHVGKALDNSRLVTFKGLPLEPPSKAHNPEIERPEQFQSELFAFLTELAADDKKKNSK